MTAMYRCLLAFYPRMHRHKFADEMLDVFVEAEAEARGKGIRELTTFYFREFTGLASGGLREQLCATDICERESFRLGGIMIRQTRCDRHNDIGFGNRTWHDREDPGRIALLRKARHWRAFPENLDMAVLLRTDFRHRCGFSTRMGRWSRSMGDRLRHASNRSPRSRRFRSLAAGASVTLRTKHLFQIGPQIRGE